jgi:TP901 family phage tail tape measure protein
MALKLGEAFALIGLRTGSFDAGLKRVQASFQMGIRRMEAVAAKARMGLLLAGGMAAVAVKAAAGFEQGMARVAALTSATGAEFDALKQKAKDLGRTTVFSARQSAEAMGFFALAGFKSDKILASMKPTLDLAAAGQLDVAQAADIAAKIMAGMKLSASELTHTVDVLAKAFTTSNTDLVQLGEAMRHVGPVGKASGKKIEELVATIQVMSNAGIQGASAGMALRNMLIRLQAQPSEVKKALKLLGVEIADESGKMKHLGQVVNEVKAGLQKYTLTEQQAIIAALAGTRAMAAFSAMMSEGGDAIREMERRLQDAGGTAKRIADIQLNTFQGRLTILKSAAEGLAITIGEQLLPPLRKLVNRITKWTSVLAESGEGAVSHALGIAKVIVQYGILLLIMPKILGAMSALMGLTAAGGALALGLTAIAGMLGMYAMAAASAAASGKDFNEVLYEQLTNMTGLRNRFKEMREEQAKQVAATKDLHKMQTTETKGGEAAADQWFDEVKAQEERVKASQKVVSQRRKDLEQFEKRKAAEGFFARGAKWRGEERALKDELRDASVRVRAAEAALAEARAGAAEAQGREMQRQLVESLGPRTKDTKFAKLMQTVAEQEMGLDVAREAKLEAAQRKQFDAFMAKAGGMLWLGKERLGTMMGLRGIGGRIEEAEGRAKAARRTPEFTAIADFAKSIQTRIQDKKAINVAEKQLEVLKKQREIQEKRLVSIDEQLKKGLVGRAG